MDDFGTPYLYYFGGSLLELWYHGPQNPILRGLPTLGFTLSLDMSALQGIPLWVCRSETGDAAYYAINRQGQEDYSFLGTKW